MKNPDKYIRKFFSERLSGLVVNGKSVRVYDTHTPNNDTQAVILSTQSGSDDWEQKCKVTQNKAINIDIFTRYPANTGSRAFLDDIVEEVVNRCTPPVVENFIVQDFRISYPNDITTKNSTETIFRQIITINLKLTENG